MYLRLLPSGVGARHTFAGEACGVEDSQACRKAAAAAAAAASLTWSCPGQLSWCVLCRG